MDSVSSYIMIIKTLAAQYDIVEREINPFGCYLWFEQVILCLSWCHRFLYFCSFFFLNSKSDPVSLAFR